MLTNPSTLGVFERQIREIAEIVHAAGGLSVLRRRQPERDSRRALPADMGFDVIHINLHKTFSTPHGGGGPGFGRRGRQRAARAVSAVPSSGVMTEGSAIAG